MVLSTLIYCTTMKPLSYIKESYQELRKVRWPSRKTAFRYTSIVVVASIVAAAVIGGIDFLLVQGLGQLIS
jgi:preprotein translocase SecE subunit